MQTAPIPLPLWVDGEVLDIAAVIDPLRGQDVCQPRLRIGVVQLAGLNERVSCLSFVVGVDDLDQVD
jgi:hypothetical protein